MSDLCCGGDPPNPSGRRLPLAEASGSNATPCSCCAGDDAGPPDAGGGDIGDSDGCGDPTCSSPPAARDTAPGRWWASSAVRWSAAAGALWLAGLLVG